MGDLNGAEGILKNSISSCKKLFGNENIELARALFNLGIVYKKKLMIKEAIDKIK